MGESKQAGPRLGESTGALGARLWRQWMRPHLGRILAGFALMAVAAAAAGLYPLIIDQAIDAMTALTTAAAAGETHDSDILFLLPVAVVVVTFVKGMAAFGQSVITQGVAVRIIANLQRAMFAHLMRADLALYQTTATGRLVSRFTIDVNMLRDALAKALTGMVRDFLTILVLVGAMFYLNWLLAILVVVVLPSSALPIIRIGRRLRRVSTNTQEEMGQLTHMLDESFSGVRLVKSYRLEERQIDRASAVFETVRRLTMKSVKGRARTYPIMETLGGVAVGGVMAISAYVIASGAGTMGEFAGFLTALLMAYQPMRSLGSLNASLQEGLAAAHRVFALLDAAPKIVDAADAKALKVGAGAIRLADVTFEYGEGSPALHDVALDAPAGRTVALVGPSGAGKSTIINLILRFFDLERGAVTIDGQDIRAVTIESLRDAVALVSQDVVLFNDTVRANIAFGWTGRGQAPGDAEIEAAARAAAAHEFIMALPHRYDTVVGERGARLSGGQKQRVAIARAMLKNAPILLLDEATSALDTESEAKVQAALRRLKRGRTTLVIAHRLSTVRDADVIVVLDEGRVVETGRHADLRARGGLYERLCRLQFERQTETPPAAAAAGA